jgi:8-oxo-dGTP diphosphatase
MTKRQIRVVAGVAQRGDLYLITQRRDEAVLGGMWEFPGGRVEEGEADEAALARELQERLGVDAAIGDKLAERDTEYEDYRVHLALYSISIPEGQSLRPLRVRDARWIPSAEFEKYPFPAADQKTMDALLGFRR